MADQKPPEGQTPGSTGAEPGGETFNNLGSMESGDILQSALLVTKTASEQAHEDMKNLAGHVKGDPGEGALDDVKLQEVDQHTSRSLQEMSNVAKKIGDSTGSIMTGKLGGATQPAKKIGLGILAALLLLGVAAFAAVRFIVPGMMPPDTSAPNPGPPEIAMPNPGPPTSPEYPPNPCGPAFENPTGVDAIPLSGPLDVKWSRVPGAASYEFRVILPEGAGEPWIIMTDGTSKKIYMDNFPAAGQHTFALTAMDRSGAALCSIELAFEKPAFGGEAGNARDPEGAEPGECTLLWGC